MTIDSKTLNSKDKKFKFSGQICVDGIETFLVYKTENQENIRFFPYHKREHVFEQVLQEYGDNLESKINELILDKSVKIKADKKYLSVLRKQDKEASKNRKKNV
jgi:hypothetical protein